MGVVRHLLDRIRDAILALLLPGYDRKVRSLYAEMRELQVEMLNALEQLNAWAAREYKRKSRETKRALGGDDSSGVSDGAPARQSAPEPSPAQARARHKAEIIRRAKSGVHQFPLTEVTDEPSDGSGPIAAQG